LEPNSEENTEENDVEVMTCAKCGKAILDKESTFCAYCGVSFDSKPASSGLTTVAGILALVAAVFSVTVGVIGINYYQSYVAYYATYSMDTSGSVGFLLFAGFAIVSSAVGFAGGMLALAKKRFKFSVAGMLVMLASAVFTFVALWQFEYGLLESLLLPGISIGLFSIASVVFVVRSRTDFS
jgi:hypothetical protein